mmetsp:Transcript_108429/g.192047  ORF Transcript_108429/g.192047 Transcript_108429/m.192047 type:complete len:179 (+) Transcript_108429:94-630(+)
MASCEQLEHHLHQLLLLLVERSTRLSIPVADIKDLWKEIYGNDMLGLLKKCSYANAEAALCKVTGLRVIGTGSDAHVALASSTISVSVCSLSGRTLTTTVLFTEDRVEKLRSDVLRVMDLQRYSTLKLFFETDELDDNAIASKLLPDGCLVTAIVEDRSGIAKLEPRPCDGVVQLTYI